LFWLWPLFRLPAARGLPTADNLSYLQRGGTTRFVERPGNFDAFCTGCARPYGERESVLGKLWPWRGLWLLRQCENSA
jgi:hypothetical protein